MEKSTKIGYIILSCVFLLVILFLFYPSDIIDSQKGLDYKTDLIISQYENYFNSIAHANNLKRPFPKMVNREDNSDYLLEGKDKFEEPILTAGYFNYENESFLQKILSSTDKGKYCKGHFFSDDSSYDGKIWNQKTKVSLNGN